MNDSFETARRDLAATIAELDLDIRELQNRINNLQSMIERRHIEKATVEAELRGLVRGRELSLLESARETENALPDIPPAPWMKPAGEAAQ